MRGFEISLIGLIFFIFFISSTNAGASCRGDACHDIAFSFVNGCHFAKNHGTKRVKVSMGSHTFFLHSGETYKLTQSGKCVKKLYSGFMAWYR